MEGTLPVQPANCVVCCTHQDADENYVQCDACDKWWHFSCAGVSESISDRAWICSKCKEAPPPKPPRSISSSSTVSSYARDLARLKQRQELERRRMELELQSKFLNEQQELMDKVEETRSRASHRDERGRIADWIHDDQPEREDGAVCKRQNPLAAAQPTYVNTEQEDGAVGGFQSLLAAAQPKDTNKREHVGVQTFRNLQKQLERCQLQSLPTKQQVEELERQLQQCKGHLGLELVDHKNASWISKRGYSLPHQTDDIRAGNRQPRKPSGYKKFFDNAIPTAGEENASELNINKSNGVNITYNSPTNLHDNANVSMSAREQQCNNPNFRDFEHNSVDIQQQQRIPFTSHEQPRESFAHSTYSNVEPSPVRPLGDLQHRLDNTQNGPTSQQLSARQSLARDLPQFSGNPADWPIFISSYEHTTAMCGYTNWENMLRLQRCLKGSALETVRSRLVLPAVVPQVIETLRMRYGRPELLINALLEKVRRIPAPKHDKLEGLIEYGLAVQALCDHIVAANEYAHLTNPMLLQELVGKLPADQKLMWAGYKRSLGVVDLKAFSNYMENVVCDASSVVSFETDRLKPRGYVNSHTGDDTDVHPLTGHSQFECNFCHQAGHRIRECQTFRNLNVEERWRKVRALSLCQNCLFNHGRRSCRSNNRCNVDGCQYRHHPLLHSTRQRTGITIPTQLAESHTHQYLGSSVLFRIVPVTLYGQAGAVNTYAFLDEGSSLTLIEDDIAEQIGVSGITQPLCLRWTGNTSRVEEKSKVINVTVSGTGSQKRFKMSNVRTVSRLNLPSQTFQMEEAVKQFHYLRQLPIQSYKNAIPKLLIGLDNLHLAIPLKTREGKGNGPVAAKTRLGWCVYGNQQPGVVNQYNLHICECTTNKDLHEAMKQLYDLEEVGSGNVTLRSKEEQRALDLLEQTTVRVGEKFQTGLLWKSDHVELPDSFNMALRRLECLERKMERDPALKGNVRRQMQEFVSKGYIHKASDEELKTANPLRIWYLPVGVVINPKKPEKIRIVWDAAAKVEGVSLNSVLLKGPDQLVPLLGVLFRFRQFKIAVCSDVKEMFLQILMRGDDKHSQRILWREDPAQNPEIYLVDVATFGSSCSPASAQFVKNKNARQHSDQFPRAAEGILQSTYVDDYLDSFGSEDEACRVSEEVRLIFRSGGFELRNWISNSESVLQHLGETQTASRKSIMTSNNTERVLGMLWDPFTDDLSFNTRMSDEVQSLLESSQRPTKRQVLRCVMTLFDPLGILATFLIHGKILVQDLWRAGTEWDEDVGDNHYRDWSRWIKMISFIANVHIPRCYFPDASTLTYKESELHIFVDASLFAYSCALYLRTVDADGAPQCTLIAAKAKVAPLKPMTIPKLELQACLLGTRMMRFIQTNHSITITKRILWTDSLVALSWIRADPRNYRPFVANRVSEIQETTTVDEWRWVPSEYNPADEATKWGSGPYFNRDSQWFNGPEFLRSPEHEWPSSTVPMVDTAEEIRPSILYHGAWEPVVTYVRFSRWEKLQRCMVYVLRFVNNIRKKGEKRGGLITQQEYETAEVEIIKQLQKEVYPDEVMTLKNNQTLPENKQQSIDRSSNLYQLMPMMDERGLIRQNSRIAAAKHLHYSVRFPIILPRNHRCTELLVARYHQLYRHANSETIVNELRQLYAIPKLRSVVKSIGRNCQFCKIRKALPTVPPMAPLPLARLAVHKRPFSYVGVDYFGPLLVKQGRSNVKRWIALFTCLTVRAVHLEVAYGLTTASCISCIRRFVCRRGSPVEFYSDNATNFHGAERVLRENINREMAATFTGSYTKWTFIPPGAPHMGGAWERLVRSVKTAMGDAYTEGKLNDEELQTLIVEAESIVNTRPLTYLPLESAESEALTPNHFLLGNSNGIKQPSVDIQKGPSRETWNHIQRQLNRFWQRWLKEYLPVIRKQTKWFEETRHVQVGDVVMIVDETKRNGWIRGRVIGSIKAQDGHIRQAIVETTGGVLRRPVSKLAVIDVGISTSSVADRPHSGEDVTTEITIDQDGNTVTQN